MTLALQCMITEAHISTGTGSTARTGQSGNPAIGYTLGDVIIVGARK